MVECKWCKEEHSIESLCQVRPRWGRRGFLSLFGMGLIGSVLPLSSLLPTPNLTMVIEPLRGLTIAQIVAVSYPAVLQEYKRNLGLENVFLKEFVNG